MNPAVQPADPDLLAKLLGDDAAAVADISSAVLANVKISNARNYLCTSAVLLQKGRCTESKKVLELVLDTIKNDRASLGLFIKGLFFFVDVSIGCSVRIKNLQSRISQLISFVDGSFRMLDSVYELVNHAAVKAHCVNFRSSDEFMQQLQAATGRQFDYYQVVSAVLYFQTLLYKCKIYVSCGDFLSARKAVHHALEIFKHYLCRVVQTPAGVTFDQADRREFSLVDYVGPLQLLEQGALSAATQLRISQHVSCLFKTAIVLSARVEYWLGHLPTASLLLSEPMLLLLAPAADEVGGGNGIVSVIVLNNEGCVSMRQRQFHRAASLFHRSLTEACRQCALQAERLPSGATRTMAQVVNELRGRGAVVSSLYNLGLCALKQRAPAEACRYFEQAVAVSSAHPESLANKACVWVRIAECCLQAHLDKKTGEPAAEPPVAAVSRGKSRRICVRLAEDMPLAGRGTLQGDSSGEQPQADCLSLEYAATCLRRALGDVRAGKRETEGAELALENHILLRLAYVLLCLGDPHGALESAQLLVTRLAGAEFNQQRFLSGSYLVQALCMLGRHEAAGDFLKSQLEASQAPAEDLLAGCNVPRGCFFPHSGVPAGAPLSPARRMLVASASLQVNKAVVLLLRGFMSAALTIVESTLRACPDYAPAVRCLIYIYLRQGRTRQALNVLHAHKQFA